MSAPYTAALTLGFPAGVYHTIVEAEPGRRARAADAADDVLWDQVPSMCCRRSTLSQSLSPARRQPRSARPSPSARGAETTGQQPRLHGPVRHSSSAHDIERRSAADHADGRPDIRDQLASGQSTAFTTAVRIPPGVKPGLYKVGIAVDPNGLLTIEPNKSNNAAIASDPIRILGLPDVFVSDLQVPAAIAPSGPVPAKPRIGNRGTTAVLEPFTFWYYLSQNSSLSIVPGDIFLVA